MVCHVFGFYLTFLALKGIDFQSFILICVEQKNLKNLLKFKWVYLQPLSRQTSIFLKMAQSSSKYQVRAGFQAFSGCKKVGLQNGTAVFTDVPNIDAIVLAEIDVSWDHLLTGRAVLVL